ncbi:ABC transporter permease [Serinicoccus kebangsaanensis]|uniref:ABC transporter permease n=1 Tax=Serinicoccus kebangsaanensis TaxID=2602069 RepID=UPI00124E676E|nr:ABC transporter permease [Serinicoccus kebangsaanensis]
MTTTRSAPQSTRSTPRHRGRGAPSTSGGGTAFAGTGTLVRFMLRRDRIKLPAWVCGLGLFVVYIGAALPQIAPTEDDLAAASPMLSQPIGRMFSGPAYGMTPPTYESFFAGGYTLYLYLLAALMNILLITRHTRLEEQSGRAELVRANVTGRHSRLTAALVVAGITNLAATVVVAGLALTNDFSPTGSLLVGAGVGLTGMAFAGVSAITAQLSEYSRSASGLAGIVLGVAFGVRALGDMAEQGGSTLSWFSPLAWPGQTAPYVLDRWWPLLLPVALAVVTIAVAFALQDRRDLGAGLLAARPGRAEATPSLGTVWGLAARLQRGPVLAWGFGILVLGVVDGLFTQVMLDSAGEMPEALRQVFGAEQLADGYMSFLAVFGGYLTAAFIVYAVQSLKSEEDSGRAEAVLATPTARVTWGLSHVVATGVGAVLIMLVTGLAVGAAASGVTGTGSIFGDAFLAHLNVLPAVLVTLGVCTLAYGCAPRLLAPVGWALVAVMFFVGNFAALLDVPDWIFRLSPLDYPAQVPVEDIAWRPLLWLALVALAGVVLGLVGLRRRQISARS